MIIIPAIDLLGGQVVRLKQGDYNKKTVYSNDPASVAEKFVIQGAKWFHIVDLDGARTGKMKNLPLILEMQKRVAIHLQVGGGIRSMESVDSLLKSGIDRVVLGTRALEDAGFLQDAIKQFGCEKIAVSLDVKDGTPMIRGWKKRDLVKVESLLRFFKHAGVSYLIYTDIVRDGMQTGPNFQAIKKIRGYEFKVIASGGVSSVGDVRRLENMGAYGCIVGRAVYGNKEIEILNSSRI